MSEGNNNRRPVEEKPELEGYTSVTVDNNFLEVATLIVMFLILLIFFVLSFQLIQ